MLDKSFFTTLPGKKQTGGLVYCCFKGPTGDQRTTLKTYSRAAGAPALFVSSP
jgi:hypothetical protein